MGLTIIGNDEGAVLVDNVSGHPLQGCRSFSSTEDAETFLEWYAVLAVKEDRPQDLRSRPGFEVADLRTCGAPIVGRQWTKVSGGPFVFVDEAAEDRPAFDPL